MVWDSPIEREINKGKTISCEDNVRSTNEGPGEEHPDLAASRNAGPC